MSVERGSHLDVADILAAAAIPRARVGLARGRQLSEPERSLYDWILRRFAGKGRPNRTAIANEASGLGLNHDDALAAFARDDLIHVDEDGEVAIAYPFSGRVTAHRIRFLSGTAAYAMCALDALGISAMLHETTEIASRDPLTGAEIQVTVRADGAGEWRPRETVVVTGAALNECGPSYCACCPVLNFFASHANAVQWLEQHSDVRGRIISMPAAIKAGRAVFADVLGPQPHESAPRALRPVVDG